MTTTHRPSRARKALAVVVLLAATCVPTAALTAAPAAATHGGKVGDGG